MSENVSDKEVDSLINKIKEKGKENFYSKQYFAAISDYKKALDVCKIHSKVEIIFILESNISGCYFQLKKYNLSLLHAENCLRHNENFQNGYVRKFYCYLYLLSFEKAENAIKKMNDNQLRKECYDKINRMKKIIKLKESGNANFKKKKYHSAISDYKGAIVLCEKYEIELEYILESNISAAYFQLKYYVESLDHAKRSLSSNEYYQKGYIRLFYSFLELDHDQLKNAGNIIKKIQSSHKKLELTLILFDKKKRKQVSKKKFELKSLCKPSLLKLGFGELCTRPHRLNTIERVRADTELQRVFKGKYDKIYNFTPCGKKESGAAIGNIYLKDKTNPKSKNKPKKRWLGKICLQKSSGVVGSHGLDSYSVKTEYKNEREMNKNAVLEFIANNLYRVLGDGMFETVKTRIAKLPILNKYLNDFEIARTIMINNDNILEVTKSSLRVMSKWSNFYHDLSRLRVVYPPENRFYKFMDYIKTFGRIPEKVIVVELGKDMFMDYILKFGRIPEKVLTEELGKKVEIHGIAGLLATSTSIGDIDVFGNGGKNTGYIYEKNQKGEIVKIRIVKIDPGFSFNFEEIRKNNNFEDARDIRYCPNDVNVGIKWKFFTHKQKNEFLEVKLHQLELIKNQKILEYLFYRNGIFNRSDIEMDSSLSSKFIENLVSHIKVEGELYEKDLCEYKKIRDNVLEKEFEELYFRGDYDRCLCLGEKLLELYTDDNPTDVALNRIYNLLGNVYYSKGEYSKALENYQMMFKLNVFPSDNPSIATCYHNMGGVYYSKGKYSKSIENFEKSLKIRLKIFSSDDPDVSKSYLNLGSLYRKIGKYSKAIKNFQKGLFKVDHPADITSTDIAHLAESYNILGILYSDKGMYSSAIENFQKSLDQLNVLHSESDHLDIAQCYNNLGFEYDKKGEFSKSIENFKRSLEIQQKILPFDHPDIGATYNNLGSAHFSKGEYSKAKENYLRASKIKLKILPSDHLSIAHTYDGLGLVFYSNGNYPKAIENHERSLEIKLKVLLSDHPDIARCYNNLGIAYRKIGKYSKAIENYQKSLKILLKTLPSDRSTIATCYHNLGNVYLEIGELSKAFENIQRGSKIRLLFLPSDHNEVGSSYHSLGNLYCMKLEYSKGIEYYKMSLNIKLKVLPDHPDIYGIYNDMGNAYCMKGEFLEGLTFLQKAKQLFCKKFSCDHPQFQKLEKNEKMWIEIVNGTKKKETDDEI